MANFSLIPQAKPADSFDEGIMRTGTAARRTFEVALVEDSKSEAWLILEALKKDHRRLHVAVLPDGERASDYLHEPLEHRPYPFHNPDLILLNLNIPRKDAFALLAEIRSSPDLHSVPVVVLANGGTVSEICRCYEEGANCVLTKPLRLESYVDALRAAGHYWLDIMAPVTPAWSEVQPQAIPA
jgi:DNA-binding response OmpR family regulator